ncbi:hypothetical protein M9Y10_034821 [Tritrichomonas musculus]|uniref:Uncharacterized protein n=1 Tax=Tritrichomonas musculus TaxID=1915356 RepID=A0ABR2KG41_9EUKA
MSYDSASTRELHWGISHVANVQPQNRRITAFSTIKKDLYISSDGSNSYIWNKDRVVQTINLPAIALHYIKKIDHIISSVKNSTHLHFIWMIEPSSVVVHPLSFSIRTITCLFYLPKSGTLVTAGQGITFSKMIIPQFSGKGPFSQLIEFSRLTELYKDEIFTKVNSPLFIESEDSIAVPIGQSLFVHSSDGTLIGSMPNLMPGRISSLSFYEEKRLIVIGNEFGNVYFVEFGQFYSKIATNISNNSHILMAALFDRYFLVTVELDHTLSLINVNTESRIETININPDIITARVEENQILMFSKGIDVFIYEVSIFTKFLTHLTSNALKIERYLEPNKPSTLFCFQKDFIVSSFIGKTGRKLLELMSSSLSNEIVDFTLDDDSLFLRFYSGNIIKVDIVHQRDLFSISNSFDDSDKRNQNKLKKTVIKVPLSVTNVTQIIKYDKNNNEKCILAVSSTGYVYAFSIEKCLLFEKVYLGCTDLICGVFLRSYNRFVISSKTQMIVLESETLRVLKRIDRALITCFFAEEEKLSLFAGDAHGCIECFELPTLSSISRSLDFNKTHTSNGKRAPLSEFNSMSEIPFAVKYLSYLKSRDTLISVSNEGEIFLWTSNLFPLAHINFSYGISAGCFYDSNGSLLVSSFESLFVIPYGYFFERPAEKEESGDLDEYNQLEANIERPFSSVKVSPTADAVKNNNEKSDKTRKKKKKRNFTILNDIKNENETNLLRNTINSETRVRFVSDNESDNIEYEHHEEFEDLVVELDFIPKNHFIKIEDKITSKVKIRPPKEPDVYKDDDDREKKPAPPPEKPPKTAPRKTKSHKNCKKTKKTKKQPKTELKPKPPPEKQIDENSPKRKKPPVHAYRSFYSKNGPNNDSNIPKNSIADHSSSLRRNSINSEQGREPKPPFSVEVHKKLFNDHDNDVDDTAIKEPIKPPPTFITSESIDDLDDLDNINSKRSKNKNDGKGTMFHSHNIEFIEPKFEYGKIGTVTMEELENYMKDSVIFIKKPTSSQRRSKSLKNSQNQNQRYQYNNNNNQQQLRFPRVTRIQRNNNNNNSRQLYYNNMF